LINLPDYHDHWDPDGHYIMVVEQLWEDTNFKRFFNENLRTNAYALYSGQWQPAFDYFAEKISDIGRMDYVLTHQDLVTINYHSSARITSSHLNFDRFTLQLTDCGGRRNERRYWILAIEDDKNTIFCSIFFVSLISYCEAVPEDDRKNNLEESLVLFQDLFERWSRGEPNFIHFLVFTKEDLLPSLRYHPFRKYFPNYLGTNEAEDVVRHITQLFMDRAQEAKISIAKIFFLNCLDEIELQRVFQSVLLSYPRQQGDD
jgi:hypothetical protein